MMKSYSTSLWGYSFGYLVHSSKNKVLISDATFCSSDFILIVGVILFYSIIGYLGVGYSLF